MLRLAVRLRTTTAAELQPAPPYNGRGRARPAPSPIPTTNHASRTCVFRRALPRTLPHYRSHLQLSPVPRVAGGGVWEAGAACRGAENAMARPARVERAAGPERRVALPRIPSVSFRIPGRSH